MKCVRVHRARRAVRVTAAAFPLCFAAHAGAAQQPYPLPTYPQQPYPGYPATYPQVPTYPTQPGTPVIPSGAALPAYRPPLIAVAQPGDGIALPDDKPVVVLRFATGELLDPLDALSLTVTVDGEDRTSLFQATPSEAWGPISSPGELLSAGQHEVRARICTGHGACSVAKSTVNIVPAASVIQLAAGAAADKSKSQRRGRVFDAVLQAVRVLIR